jgi:type I restriction enzyme M protein
MNLYLHGLDGDENPVVVGDALISDPGEKFDYVLINPPFGKKSSITIFNGNGDVKGGKETLLCMKDKIFGHLHLTSS